MDIERRIINCLRKHERGNPRIKGLSIKELSERLNLSRATVSKYTYALWKRGKLGRREVGRCNIFFLKREQT